MRTKQVWGIEFQLRKPPEEKKPERPEREGEVEREDWERDGKRPGGVASGSPASSFLVG